MMRIWLVLGMLAATMASAFAGNELGNGGDGYAQEFVGLGRTMVARLKEGADPAVTDPEALARAVEEAKVITLDNLNLNGAPVDAINYPVSKTIELSRARWKEYSVEQKRSLVLHEYLGVARVDDSHYQISGNYSVARSESDEISPRRIFFGLGSGMQSFFGNIGKLYFGSRPILDLRLGYALSPHWLVNAGLENAQFKFTAAETGTVKVGLLKASAAAQFHFFPSSQWSGSTAIDPYLVANVGQNFRTQDFQDLNTVQKDNALSAEAGLGANFPLQIKRAAIWVEGRVGQVFFADRRLETFLPESGIPDTTGMLLSAGVGLQYFF